MTATPDSRRAPYFFGTTRVTLASSLIPGALGLALMATACEQSSTPKPPAAQPAAAAKAPASTSLPKATHGALNKAPAAKKQADLVEWDSPEGLTKIKPKNSFRRESYEIAPGKGETAVGILNVFAFGGDIEGNLTRWKGQFAGLDEKTVQRIDREVNGLKQTILEIPTGKYSGGMAPEEGGDNFGMLAALVPVRPEGATSDVLYIFKMTGPSAGVQNAKASFMKMLDTVRPAAAGAGAQAAPDPHTK